MFTMISTMKSIFQTIVLTIVLLSVLLSAQAATRYSVKTGMWSVNQVWSATSGGSGGASSPVAGDLAIIEGGYTVSVNNTQVPSLSLKHKKSYTPMNQCRIVHLMNAILV